MFASMVAILTALQPAYDVGLADVSQEAIRVAPLLTTDLADASCARTLCPKNAGIAIAARIPMITTNFFIIMLYLY